MRILLIWPNRDTFGCKPLGLSLLAAKLRLAGHEIDLFDTTFIDLGCKDYNLELTKRGYFKPVDYGCDVSKKPIELFEALEEKIKLFRPDLFLMSVLSDEVGVALQIIRHIQEVHPREIMVGNKGAEKLSRLLCYAGVSCFYGEAIGTLDDIIAKRLYIKQKLFFSPGYFKDLDTLPMLDWSIFDQRHFLRAYDGRVYRSGDHMIGWGCPNSCTYCINEHWRGLHGGMRGCMRRYSVNRIIKELCCLALQWELKFFKFHDEDFLLKPHDYFCNLSDEYLCKIGLPFSCMTNAKSVTERRAKLLAQMGCVSVSIGIETGNYVMRSMLNRRESPSDIIRAVQLLQNHGMRVSSFNMIGLPFESEASIEETIELNRKAGIKYPNVSFYIPLEGTRLYDIAVAARFYDKNSSVSTDTPSLRLPGITEQRLFYYYDNFHRFITE